MPDPTPADIAAEIRADADAHGETPAETQAVIDETLANLGEKE